MPEVDVHRLLEATKRRSRHLRTRRRLLAGGMAIVAAVAIAVPVALFSGGSSRHPVIVSPGPSTPSTSAKAPLPTLPGSTLVTVPDVVGQIYFPTAQMTLGRANLNTVHRFEHSMTVVAGVVTAQDPVAGTAVPSATAVTLVVSTGPAEIPGVRPCQAANLRVQPGEPVSEASGQRTADWSLTNTASPCVLDGYPGVTALDQQGRVLGFMYSHSGDQMTTGAQPQPVYLPEGSSAWIRLNAHRCDIQTQDTAETLKVTLPSDDGTLTLPAAINYCNETSSLTITVSPFEPVEPLLSANS